MAKRVSKTEREAAEQTALKARLRDLALGAYGGYSPFNFDGDEFAGMASEMGLEAFGRWIGAIGNALLDEKSMYLIEARCLEHFDSLDEAVKHLWESGVRA